MQYTVSLLLIYLWKALTEVCFINILKRYIASRIKFLQVTHFCDAERAATIIENGQCHSHLKLH
jgi:hypothetical protein